MEKTYMKDWLASEANQKKFSGWDFSYLEGKMEQAKTPWCYKELVKKHLQPTMQLLDMGTGGGELLESFHHPYERTAVTEGWEPNYQLLLNRLQPKGVHVQFVEENNHLAFPDAHFDMVVNSHEAFSVSEVWRVLKKGGYFISQQVGDLNGLPLSTKLIPNFKKDTFNQHLSSVVAELRQQGFSVVFQDEAFFEQKFFDLDGLIYYVKTIPWEFPDFSVATHYKQLLYLKEELSLKGFIFNQEHRFIFIARK